MLEQILAPLTGIAFSEGDTIWLEALPARTYNTLAYGEVPVTVDKLNRLLANWKSGIRGQEVATDFDHGLDVAKGNKASGWYKDFKIAPSSANPAEMSLWAAVQFTEEAKQEIQNAGWKYFSLEWDDLYHDVNTGTVIPDVIIGGGVTNRPIAKHTMPINFSETMWDEVDDDTKRRFAVWSTAQMNDLPDSCFLYVEPGGSKDSSGKTTPRSKRHFPYKDSSGKVDLPHLRNAIARIPQSGISTALKSQLQNRARRILAAQTKKGMSEAVAEAVDLLSSSGMSVEVYDEVADLEHSEPGTGSPPTPRTDGDTDPAIESGSRRDPLPLDPSDPRAPKPNSRSEGGSVLTPEQIATLNKLLGIKEDAATEDTLAAITALHGEVQPLRDAAAAAGEERQFAERYPTYWREHQAMLAERNQHNSVAFSESVKAITRVEGDPPKNVATNNSLSTAARDKIAEVHRKFAEGTVTTADFEETVRAIVNGGIVQLGEIGSSIPAADPTPINTGTMGGLRDARKAFAEKVAEIQAADSLEYAVALQEAAKRHPDLAAAWQQTVPA